MSSTAIARRYAVALTDVLMKQGNAADVQRELTTWSAMLTDNPNLYEVFANPTVNQDQKQNLLNVLLAKTLPLPVTANFLKVLLQNQRLIDLPAITESLARELDARSGMVSAEVTTARPLDAAARETLRTQLTQLTKKGVRLDFKVDESLIGGIVTRIGSTIYDGSVKTQLEQAKDKMMGEKF